jgi:Leucine-rich repeat (LRR) protein
MSVPPCRVRRPLIWSRPRSGRCRRIGDERRPRRPVKGKLVRPLVLPLALGLLPLTGCMTGYAALSPPNAAHFTASDSAATLPSALVALKKAGGKVTPDTQPILAADLHGLHLTSEIMDCLTALPQLRELNLYNTDLTDADLQRLTGLKELQTLNLRATHITDAGLASLQGLPALRALYLSDSALTDAGLRVLAAMPHLQDLDLTRTKVTDEGIAQLRNLHELQKLSLGGPGITDQGLAALAGLRSLRELRLARTGVTDAGARALQTALPQLAIIR